LGAYNLGPKLATLWMVASAFKEKENMKMRNFVNDGYRGYLLACFFK
jgi:hypothetical protein